MGVAPPRVNPAYSHAAVDPDAAQSADTTYDWSLATARLTSAAAGRPGANTGTATTATAQPHGPSVYGVVTPFSGSTAVVPPSAPADAITENDEELTESDRAVEAWQQKRREEEAAKERERREGEAAAAKERKRREEEAAAAKERERREGEGGEVKQRKRGEEEEAGAAAKQRRRREEEEAAAADPNKALIEACKAGSAAMVSDALDAGGDPKAGLKFMFGVISQFEKEVAMALVRLLKSAEDGGRETTGAARLPAPAAQTSNVRAGTTQTSASSDQPPLPGHSPSSPLFPPPVATATAWEPGDYEGEPPVATATAWEPGDYEVEPPVATATAWEPGDYEVETSVATRGPSPGSAAAQ